MTEWTHPSDVLRQLQRRWDKGDIPAALLCDEASLFPLRLRCRTPTSAELGQGFGEVRDWIRALRAGDREHRGHGYEIQWRRLRHPVHGANELPAGVVVPTETDALKLLGKTREAALLRELAESTLADFPELAVWLGRHPLRLLEQAERWPRLLDVLRWFREHPRPGVYLRQVDIPGVDTKLIEGHRGLLSELLDIVLPDDAIDTDATGVRGFARRYGLRDKPARVRFRMLDPTLAINGLTDLEVPTDQFAGLGVIPSRVFITENEINGLAFPEVSGAMVIFGQGYGVERLAEVAWLRDCDIRYWGDIDTHGFAILDRLRGHLPHVRSLLMNEDTLLSHRELWVTEPRDRRFTGELKRLTETERDLFMALRDDRFGERVRLEQERIRYGWLLEALESD